jgi:6-phosphogluconolactonase (cycloisomerase 2 family)
VIALEGSVALWVGCYTSDMDGGGEGIVALGRGADGAYAPLGPATAVASPSFLALHPSQPVLYAVSERAALVHAYRFDGSGTLSALGPAGIASSLACHVAVAPDGAFLVASCWGDGSVVLFELEADGLLGRRHGAPASEDPYGEDRQSRAHSCLMLGDGRMLTTDLGHDLIRCWRFSADRGLESRGTVTLPHGCGPRHFARSSTGIVYVDTEYSAEVIMLAPPSSEGHMVGPETNAPWLELRGVFPVSAAGARPGDSVAEICLDRAEQHLYVGVRGSDVICKLALDADGVPSPLEQIPCGGAWPRHHCIDADRLVVALEHSDALATFTLAADGSPTQPPQLLATGSPTCVLPHSSPQ